MSVTSILFTGFLLTQPDPELLAAEKPLCGAYCLYVALLTVDAPVPGLDEVESRLGRPPRTGYSLAQLAKVAESYGMHSLGITTDLDRLSLRQRPFACIAHWGKDHFVNILDVASNQVTYFDSPTVRSIPRVTFETRWDGNALLISRHALAPEEDIVVRDGWGGWRMAAVIASVVVSGAAVAYGVWRRA